MFTHYSIYFGESIHLKGQKKKQFKGYPRLERIWMLWRVEFFQNNIRATLIFSKSQVHCIIWARHNKCTQ